METTVIVKGNVTFNIDNNVLNEIDIAKILEVINNSDFSSNFFNGANVVNIFLSNTGSIANPTADPATIGLDPSDWDDDYYIGFDGNQAKFSKERVFIHELIHVLQFEGDPSFGDGNLIDDLTEFSLALRSPEIDLIGPTERKTNIILQQLYNEVPRGHYINAYSTGEQSSYTQTVWELQTKQGGFTGGKTVDDVIFNVNTGPLDCRIDGRVKDGLAQSDLILGFDGVQTIYAGGGTDFIYAGAGNDLASGGTEVDVVQGNEGNDILTGGDLPSGFTSTTDLSKTYFQTLHREFNDSAKDTISGGAGHDTIIIETDAQTSDGFYDTAPPSDLRQVLDKLDFVDGSDQDYLAHVQYDSGANPLYFSFTQDSVATALAGGNQVIGTSEFFYQGNWQQLGDVVGFRVDDVNGVGAVMLLGSWAASWGQEFYAGVTTTRDLSQSGGQWTVLGGDPTDAPNQQAEGVSEAELAETGVDTLYGGNALDGIYAYGGNDTIVLGAYVGGADYVDGGAGSDTVDYTGTSSKLVISIADTYNGTVTGLGAANNDVLANIENISTGSGADDVTGSSAANTIRTDGGADTIHGGGGNDMIYAGGGADKMWGEAGSDNYYVDNAGDVVTEAGGQGTDTVYTTITYTLTANVEKLVLQSGAIDGTGNALANTIIGSAAANTLDGGAGADTLIGGAGNDVYIVDNSSDSVTELASEGTDRIEASISITALAANVENLTLTNSADIDGAGNGLANVINGNGGDNSLSGGNGNDTLNGKVGVDVLSGGGGADRLVGGVGNDTLTGGAGDDTFVFSVGSYKDRLTDFLTGADIIDLSSIAEITSINDLRNNHVSDGGSYIVIKWNDETDSVRLDGIADKSELLAANFLFG